MSHIIYKYRLSPTPGRQVVNLPLGARILSFGNQDETPTMWALVNPKNEPKGRVFDLHFTGQLLPDERDEDVFIGTASLGPLMYHLFERRGMTGV